jgi:hypothetical protein
VFTSVVAAEELSATFPLRVAPDLTRRERDALIALCRPLLEHGMLSEPATVTSIAVQLVVTESAAKKLLGRLYDRFGLIDADRRRGRLALEALQTAAISPDDIDGT